jgi:DNA-binding CsgD family transcriptional regulator
MCAFIFVMGYLFVNISTMLRGWSPTFLEPDQLLQLVIAGLFFLSSRSSKLYWIQPAIFLAVVPLASIGEPKSFYPLGFYILGVLLLFKIGFFKRHRVVKSIAVILYLYIGQVGVALFTGQDYSTHILHVFFVTAFLVILWILYNEEIIVYLKEPKPILDLRASGLSEAEIRYILDLQAGKASKEIAIDSEVSESTVRNTLARAYQKLAVKDKAELLVLLSKSDVRS